MQSSKRSNAKSPTSDENEVLRRMLHTPPTPHKPMKAKPAPARKKKSSKTP